VGIRQQQALLIALSMYVNQVRLYQFQQADIGDLVIDKDPSPPAGDQLSPDQRFALACVHARFRQQFLEGRIALYFKDAFDECATLSRPDEVRGRAIAQQQSKSVYEDRFPRPGFPAQDVEAMIELYLQPINNRKIYDIQKSQHIPLAVSETRLRR